MARTLEEIKEIFKDYSDGLRIIMLVHRNKEGGIGRKAQKTNLKKIITQNSEEFWEAIAYMRKLKEGDLRPLRIYSTVNSRNLQRTIHNFKRDMLENDYSKVLNKDFFYIDIKNRFISALMKKACKSQSNFLFDLDECDDHSFHSIHNQIERQTKIQTYYQTKNGYHIITDPFNYNKLECLDQVDIHPDGLLLIDY